MKEPAIEQIRNFRLHSHHLDADYQMSDIALLAGACGMQNTPPGAWETALHSRVPGCTMSQMEDLLNKDRLLLQAWSYRGAPVVFPEAESDVFLYSLASIDHGGEKEPWIYTSGISLALEYLQMDFDELLELLMRVMPRLDDALIISKNSLDQTLASWMLPFLPARKQDLWNHPSMYGDPNRQTVGGAVVSFLLRPCSFHGLVVFAKRQKTSPSFTSYKNWVGHPMQVRADAPQRLVRKFLHCYGPATLDMFIRWLGCSNSQGKRLWKAVEEEMEPVLVLGKKAFILSSDRERLFSPSPLQKELLFLAGHDPYLDQRDRLILQPDKSLHRKIWQLVANPGAIIYRGEIVGIWNSRKKGKGMDIKAALWDTRVRRQDILALAEEYAAFRQQAVAGIEFL